MEKEYTKIEFIESEDELYIEEQNELIVYEYISNHLHFEYFVGYEIATLIGYKSPKDIVTHNVSKCNQLVFREYPGVKIPELDPRTILITRDGVIEILLKTRKSITPDVLHILKKFNIDTTNKKCLTKEQQTFSSITNAFKTETFEDQYKVGKYYLDLYFPEYKIIIECDENGHTDRKPYKERERMDFVNEKLGLEDSNWIRYNPDEKDFDITKVIGKIYRKIKENDNVTNNEFYTTIKKTQKKSVNQYSLEGKFIKTFESIRDASLETGISNSNITCVCSDLYESKSAGMYLWKYNNGNFSDIKPFINKCMKSVAQYTLDGELLKVFKSVASAANELNVFKGRSEISRVCNGELSSSYGFMWRYVENNNVLKKIEKYELHSTKSKKIHMYKDNILLNSFYTIFEAAKKTNKSRSAISKYINGKSIDKQGYIWKNIDLECIKQYEISNNVYLYNKDEILINSFENISDASRKTNKSRTTISNYIKKGKDQEGNIWKKIL